MGSNKAMVAPVPVVRLQVFTNHLRDIGTPIDCRLRREGLPVLCSNPDHVVPIRRAWSFFDYAARSEDPFMGWRVGTVK